MSFATVNRWESGRTQMSARASRALAEFEVRAAGPATAGLPVARSSFIGRDPELAELTALITASRLVSLVGPGGAGKTRLAIEAIRRASPAAEVVFVPLEPVRQSASLVPAVASSLRVRDQPGLAIQESLAAALATAPRLLVLDGAEHLRDAVAGLAGQLLAAVEGLRIVVTSRVVLGVPGEVCWTVPPLQCPSGAAGAADIVASDAVRLFITRARERVPGFSGAAPHAIAELCRRLDGLPLAIELIAGWAGTLSVREILSQRAVLLDAAPGDAPRGRRLVDVVRTSYDLLSPEQQRLLPALSVFAGPATLDDVQSVSGGVASGRAPLAHLIRGLVDSSWLVVIPGEEHNRFAMLETLRSFAAARLDCSGDGPRLRRAHAEHFTRLATRQ